MTVLPHLPDLFSYAAPTGCALAEPSAEPVRDDAIASVCNGSIDALVADLEWQTGGLRDELAILHAQAILDGRAKWLVSHGADEDAVERYCAEAFERWCERRKSS